MIAVFTGMSDLAIKVGVAWLTIGVIYGSYLKMERRDVLEF